MSAKFLYSITDEKPDRRKQVGCMNGIFQLFDRRHFFVGRHVGGHAQKRLTPGKGQNANQGTEQSPAADRTPEKILKENGKEKQSVPPESSTTSFSSSCSSTFSSIDCNKTTAQPKPSSFSQTIYPESPSVIPPTKQQDGSSQISSGLSVKTITKEGRMGPTMKHIDSPRPLLKTPKDAPRFSYDERESRDKLKSAIKLKELPRLSLDSRVRSIKSCASEPRSICISRETILNSNQEPGSNKRPSSVVARLMGLEEAFPDSNSTADDGQMIKIKSRPHEDFDRISRSPRIGDGSQQNQVCGSPRVSHKDPGSPQLRKVNSVINSTSCSRFPLETAPWRQAHGSQKPEFKYREGITKAPNASPSVYGEIEKRLTELEFKKSGKDLRALKQILESMEKTRKRLEEQKEESPSNFESRINNFSPNYCGFDQSSKLVTRQSHQNNCSLSPNTKGTSSPKRCGTPIVIIKPAKLSVNPRDSSSDSSVIPADGISGLQRLRTGETARKDTVDRLLSKDLTLRKSVPSTDNKTKANNLRSPISPKAPRNTGENLASSGRVSGTVSPRLQQKKHRMEKQSHATTPPRQSHKQLMESGSPIRKTKMKSTNLGQVDDDQSSRFSSETRNSSHNGDTVFSMQSESSLASQIDIEVTSINCSNDPKDKVSSFPIQNFAERLSEDRSTAELATATLEQPSPISVLDAMFYVEDPPSPVKKISNFFEDDKTLDCDEAEWIVKDIDCLPNSTIPNLIFEFNHNKLEEAKHLIHKLRLVNTTRDETTMDQITSLCKRTIPDRRYIIEILFASGLLADQGSSMTNIQLHQSGHSINPNLFHLLEKIKGNTEFANNERCEQIGRSKSSERSQRKLVFDVVDEILVHKLALGGSYELGMFPNKKGMRSLSGEKLLKELWSEMDRLQTNPDLSLEDEDDGLISILSADMTNQSEDWADYHGEVPGLVLDIERLIFNDLIREVVSCGAANMQDRRRRHCKQLFFK